MMRGIFLIWLLGGAPFIASPLADAWSWGGLIAHQLGVKKVGTACLWRAYRTDPHTLRHQYNLGLSYRHTHQYHAAQQTFMALANRPLPHPLRQKTRQQLAFLAIQLGQHQAAFDWYQQMVSQPPFPARTPHDWAHITARLTPTISPPQDHGQWAAIIDQFDQALPVSPASAPTTRKAPIDW
ncbi:tetratricopeptide repeat protein [bacterium]|nr:tetratricopeptide repeat protein [bacterium]